ncbi:hypothetical protein OS493_014560 [Desmophyllum pertusum]|uniref:Thyroglobulin type-1 domain-containing protein n=1 Tax=Desmophyllum pertusum TaxID=174260 RepID=A0A9X0CN10_9CNID|nr:hypothetical protein OS493_014560 [Desmophyllum pertusum]
MRTNSFAFGTLIALISCLTDVKGSGAGNPSSTATSPTTISMLHRTKCDTGRRNSSYVVDCPIRQSGKIRVMCIEGYCVCIGQGYDYYTCLPDAYGCKIDVNTTEALAKPQYKSQQPQTTYSCTPVKSSTRFEVHVLSVHEDIKRRPPAAGYALSISSVTESQTDRLYSCLEAMNLLIGFSIYQRTLPSLR